MAGDWAEGLEEGLEDLSNLDDFDNVEMHAALRFTRNITGCKGVSVSASR